MEHKSFLIRFFNATPDDSKLKDDFTDQPDTYVVDNIGERFTVLFPDSTLTKSTEFDIEPCHFNINTYDHYKEKLGHLIVEYLQVLESKNVFKGFFFSDPELINPYTMSPFNGFFDFPQNAEYVFFAVLDDIELKKYTPNTADNWNIDDSNFKALRTSNFANKLLIPEEHELRQTTQDDLNFIKTDAECEEGGLVEMTEPGGSKTFTETKTDCKIKKTDGKMEKNKINVLTLGKHMPNPNNNEINFAGKFSIKGYLIKKPRKFNNETIQNFKMLLHLIQLGYFIENEGATKKKKIIKNPIGIPEQITFDIKNAVTKYNSRSKACNLNKIKTTLNEYNIDLDAYITELITKQNERFTSLIKEKIRKAAERNKMAETLPRKKMAKTLRSVPRSSAPPNTKLYSGIESMATSTSTPKKTHVSSQTPIKTSISLPNTKNSVTSMQILSSNKSVKRKRSSESSNIGAVTLKIRKNQKKTVGAL